jgi:hypothetical protein
MGKKIQKRIQKQKKRRNGRRRRESPAASGSSWPGMVVRRDIVLARAIQGVVRDVMC